MPTNHQSPQAGDRSQRWGQVQKALQEALVRFFNEDSLAASASIAYHSLLSIFPFLLLVMGLSGFYIKQHELAGRLAIILARYLPIQSDFILQNLVGISKAYGKVSLLSLLLLLWSSSGIFMPLEKALNRAWGAQSQRGWWHRHLLALEMAVVIGIILLLSATVVGMNAIVHEWMMRKGHFFSSTFLAIAYNSSVIVTSFCLTLAMFVVIFKGLPNSPMSFRQVLPSALLTAVFWEGARSLFILLLPVFNYRQVYGSIGVVVALMTWVYISSAVTLFGAQVSNTLYRTIRPGPLSKDPAWQATSVDG